MDDLQGDRHMKTTCSMDDCEQAILCRGLCGPHYRKARESGAIEVQRRPPKPPVTDVDLDAKTCTCPKCGPGARLRIRVRSTGSTSLSCRSCDRAGPSGRGKRPRKPYKTDERTRRAWRVRYKYGVSLEEIELRIEAQQGKCLICFAVLEKPVIDHDHARGHVRGILCQSCNTGLGFFRDDPKALRRAATYVKRYAMP